MKKITTICTLFLSIVISAQTVNTVVKDKKGKEKLLGKTTREAFKNPAFKTWFDKGYESYIPNKRLIDTYAGKLTDYTVKVFYGTWCGDSRKEIPRFYKILDAANFDEKKVEFIALDNIRDTYKQSPNHEEKGLGIHRVPTFIFYKDGKEVNRIVEHPKETIERDILKIASGKKYQPYYKAVSYLEKLFSEKSIDSIKLMKNGLIQFLPEIVKGAYELNTYAGVEWRANKLEKAEFILELNAKMYPSNYYIIKSLADFNFEQKHYEKALKLYYKSLSIYTNNEKVKERISEIEKLTKEKH